MSAKLGPKPAKKKKSGQSKFQKFKSFFSRKSKNKAADAGSKSVQSGEEESESFSWTDNPLYQGGKKETENDDIMDELSDLPLDGDLSVDKGAVKGKNPEKVQANALASSSKEGVESTSSCSVNLMQSRTCRQSRNCRIGAEDLALAYFLYIESNALW